MLPVLGRFRSLVPGVVGLASVDSLLLTALWDGFTGIVPPESGLGGKLDVLTPPRGGCGKALILIVFLIDLPAPFTPGVVRNLGRVVSDAPGVVGRGSPAAEGARKEDFGRRGGDPSDFAISDGVGMLPVLFRLLTGSAGKAVVGGPYDGLEGLGRAAAIVVNDVGFRVAEMKSKR